MSGSPKRRKELSPYPHRIPGGFPLPNEETFLKEDHCYCAENLASKE